MLNICYVSKTAYKWCIKIHQKGVPDTPINPRPLNDLSLKNARSKLQELRQLVAQGIDPRSARAATKVINAQAITMQKLFDNWIEFVKLTGKVTPTWIKRHEDRWRLHLKKILENLFVKDLTRGLRKMYYEN